MAVRPKGSAPNRRGVFCASKAQGFSRRRGAGTFFFAPRARDDAGFAGGNAPPIFFLRHQKENAPCTVEKKKMFRGGRACRILGKSLPAAWVARGFGSSGHPLLLFPLALRCSVSGAWRAGFTSTSSVDRRGVSAGETDSREGSRRAPVGDPSFGGSPLEQPPYLSELAPCAQVPRQAFFLLDGSTARSLFDASKREWGVDHASHFSSSWRSWSAKRARLLLSRPFERLMLSMTIWPTATSRS